MNPTVDILLASYNGERYLAEQIGSLLKQTHQGWHLIVRDDVSSDCSRSILDGFKTTYPEKITLIDDNLGNLGACRSFATLLEHSKADYTMFCDQDDVWLPGKIELSLQKMRELADGYGDAVPLLVYSDMKVVDRDLTVIADSYWNYQVFDPNKGGDFGRLLVSNVIIGCTVMINRKLRDIALPLPPEALMHDWWVGLVAAALGKSDFLEEPTVLYRQHASNVVGATWKMSPGSILRKLRDMKKHKAFLLQSQKQARAFAGRYGNLLSSADGEKVRAWVGIDGQNWLARRYTVMRYGFWWSGVLRNITLLLVI